MNNLKKVSLRCCKKIPFWGGGNVFIKKNHTIFFNIFSLMQFVNQDHLISDTGRLRLNFMAINQIEILCPINHLSLIFELFSSLMSLNFQYWFLNFFQLKLIFFNGDDIFHQHSSKLRKNNGFY